MKPGCVWEYDFFDEKDSFSEDSHVCQKDNLCQRYANLVDSYVWLSDCSDFQRSPIFNFLSRSSILEDLLIKFCFRNVPFQIPLWTISFSSNLFGKRHFCFSSQYIISKKSFKLSSRTTPIFMFSVREPYRRYLFEFRFQLAFSILKSRSAHFYASILNMGPRHYKQRLDVWITVSIFELSW